MSVAEGLRIAGEWQRDALARDEARRAAAWQAEQQAQQRAEWERQAQARTAAEAYMDSGLRGYEGAPKSVDPSFLDQYGMRREVPQSSYAQRQGFTPNLETPQAPAPSPARQRALDDMRAPVPWEPKGWRRSARPAGLWTTRTPTRSTHSCTARC